MRCLRTSRLWLALRHSSQPSHDPNTEEVTSGLEVVQSRLRDHLEATSTSPSNQAPPVQKQKRTSSVLPTTGINALLSIEILQHILSFVPLWPLLRCRRVCHLWNDCIPNTAPALRAALFLPSPRDKLVSEPITLHFTIMITASIIDVVPCEPPLNYTMHMDPEELARLQHIGITLHPILLGTVSEYTISDFKDVWISSTVGSVTVGPPWCSASAAAQSAAARGYTRVDLYASVLSVCEED
jgi:hypothetical protein